MAESDPSVKFLRLLPATKRRITRPESQQNRARRKKAPPAKVRLFGLELQI
jgi:hypothetical protein